MQKRRGALALIAGLAVFAIGTRLVPGIFDRLDAGFDFEPLASPEGFRSLGNGELSVALDPFIGLGNEANDLPKVEILDFESSLFHSRTSPDRLQVAYFSDLYCPYCRVLSARLLRVSEEMPIDISWHETPIFGPASVLAAKAQIAAGQQAAYADFHKALVRSPVQVTVPYLETLAERLALDLERFREDMTSEETMQALGTSRALADAFGLIGTPALVVGRTLVVGELSEVNLRQLIALELSEKG